jgi:hypothetical protein
MASLLAGPLLSPRKQRVVLGGEAVRLILPGYFTPMTLPSGTMDMARDTMEEDTMADLMEAVDTEAMVVVVVVEVGKTRSGWIFDGISRELIVLGWWCF